MALHLVLPLLLLAVDARRQRRRRM